MSDRFDVFDSFKVYMPGSLSEDDYSVLALLYQPLIGMDGFSLYMSLSRLVNQDKNSEIYPVKKILDILNIDGKILKSITNKLEGIGLMETFHHKEKGYFFKLHFPLSANSFILDGSLGVYLYSQIGEREYRNLIKLFQIKADLSDYKNVSHTFDDVYDSSIDTKYDVFMEFFDKKRNNSIQIVNQDFDYEFFVSLISKNFLKKKDLTPKLRDMIVKLAYTYKLNELQMKEVYIRSINDAGIFDYDLLPKEARKEFRFMNHKEAPKLSTKEVKVADNYEKDKLLYMVENTQPYDLLQQLSGIKPSSSDLKIIEELMTKLNIHPSIINVMILFVLNINDNKMPTYPYFEKIANEWGRIGIKSAKEALDYIKKRNKSSTKKQKNKPSNKKDNTPDWFDTYEEELKASRKKNKNTDYDDVDLESLSESLKKI